MFKYDGCMQRLTLKEKIFSRQSIDKKYSIGSVQWNWNVEWEKYTLGRNASKKLTNSVQFPL